MPVGNINLPSTIYAPDQLKYLSSEIVAVYVVETVTIAPEYFGGLQVNLKMLCVTLVTYKNNNNTYKYTVFFIGKNTTHYGNKTNVYIWTFEG